MGSTMARWQAVAGAAAASGGIVDALELDADKDSGRMRDAFDWGIGNQIGPLLG